MAVAPDGRAWALAPGAKKGGPCATALALADDTTVMYATPTTEPQPMVRGASTRIGIDRERI